jgi:hypothetical protein
MIPGRNNAATPEGERAMMHHRAIMEENGDSQCFSTYVRQCLYCGDGEGASVDGMPGEFQCLRCEHRVQKGVLINSGRMFLNNVG